MWTLANTRTATDMDRIENLKPVEKSKIILASFEHLQKLYYFSKLGGSIQLNPLIQIHSRGWKGTGKTKSFFKDYEKTVQVRA